MCLSPLVKVMSPIEASGERISGVLSLSLSSKEKMTFPFSSIVRAASNFFPNREVKPSSMGVIFCVARAIASSSEISLPEMTRRKENLQSGVRQE